jgi:hypothetical protein
MADNSSVPVATGNETFANKDIAGVKFPKFIRYDSAGAEFIGGKTPAASEPVVPADQYAQYETVAASASAQSLGASGATGDYLAGVLVFPGTAACGVVTILDNAITIGTFAGGGTTALADLKPFLIPVGLFSVSGAWKITTGANVTAVGIGKFT